MKGNPPKEHRFKKGKSGNPNGRPKGSKNKNTQLKKLLKDLGSLSEQYTGKDQYLKLKVYKLYNLVKADFLNDNIDIPIEHLYFMQGQYGVKIGKSINPEMRLSQIKQSMDSNAELIKYIPAAGGFEYKLHKKFREYNIIGNSNLGNEWFKYNQELQAFINSVNTLEDLNNYFSGKKYKTTKATQNTQKRIINTPKSHTLFSQVGNSI